jgi:hypothetical protein
MIKRFTHVSTFTVPTHTLHQRAHNGDSTDCKLLTAVGLASNTVCQVHFEAAGHHASGMTEGELHCGFFNDICAEDQHDTFNMPFLIEQ